jgi:hypothetical protein
MAAVFFLVAAINSGLLYADCAACHPAETKLYSITKMANAMVRASESSFAVNLPDRPLKESNDGYLFAYIRTSDKLTVTAFRNAERADGIIKWVLGAGAQGQTPLVETQASIRESRVSYFPQLRRYGITIGQDAGPSRSADAALGRSVNSDRETCVGCHATSGPGEANFAPGVQCERCHPGAEQHAHGQGRPFNPGKAGAAQQVTFCGGCHRTKPPVDDNQLENVRFQPLRLIKSRCFSSGKLACTTCHPAHQDARRRAAAFYNERCVTCHASPAPHTDERARGDCIGCHMPYIELHPALRFTDHFIRIVRANDVPKSLVRQRDAGAEATPPG